MNGIALDGQRLKIRLDDTMHYLEIVDAYHVLQDGYLRHIYQDGDTVPDPRYLLPVTEHVQTGNAFTDPVKAALHLTLHTMPGREWVAIPSAVYEVVGQRASVAELKEVIG